MQGSSKIWKSIGVIYSIKKVKNKNHMIISIDVEKASDKIQHPFMIKTVYKVGKEGTCITIIKAIYKKPTTHYSQRSKFESIYSKIRNKTQVSTLTIITLRLLYFHNIVLKVLAKAIREEKRNKRNPNWQRRNKTLSLFIDDMILYIENPKNTTSKLINDFSNRIQN